MALSLINRMIFKLQPYVTVDVRKTRKKPYPETYQLLLAILIVFSSLIIYITA
jgi:hypothetical protein